MEDLIQKNTPISLHTVQAKARSLVKNLKSRAGCDNEEEFPASNGWFSRFKKRFALHNVRITGEAGSSDVVGAQKFSDSFETLVKQEGYIPEQIFNVDETGLQWKRMPNRTYIHQEAKQMPGFKAFKDRLTLLLGGN